MGNLAAVLKFVGRSLREPTGVGSCIGFLLGLVLVLLPTRDAVGSGETTNTIALSAVGYSLIAASLFAFLSQFYIGNSLLSQVDKSMRQGTERLGSDVSRVLREFWRQHMPSEEYPATDLPNPRFNDSYNGDLQVARQIMYRGQSGLYLASRLFAHGAPELQDLQVIAEHPFSEDVIAVRTKNYLDRASRDGRSQNTEEIREDVRERMLLAIVGLFDLRANYFVSIRYTGTLLQVRTEIVGRATYITYEPRNQAGVPRFPHAYRFGEETLLARLAYLEFEREFGRLSTRVEFRASDTDEKLLAHLDELGFKVDGERLASLRDTVREISGELSASMVG